MKLIGPPEDRIFAAGFPVDILSGQRGDGTVLLVIPAASPGWGKGCGLRASTPAQIGD